MRPEEGDAARLWDMRRAVKEIVSFVEGMSRSAFLADRRSVLAVERNLEILSEAAAHLSASFRDVHPEIPWRGTTAPRNVLVHAYGEIDPDLFWTVVSERVPELRDLLAQL